jgi:hypothetical protein
MHSEFLEGIAMKKNDNRFDRREFIKKLGAASLSSILASAQLNAKEKEAALPQVPKRKLGKTGVEVPCLSLGSNAAEDPILLRRALDWGVSYWDS